MRFITRTILLLVVIIFPGLLEAEISSVKVENKTNVTIYIHKGAYAQSESIAPGQSKIFYYPFYAVPPNSNEKIKTSLLLVSAGGQWATTPEGFTYLDKPQMLICQDYQAMKNKYKTGDRLWVIQNPSGFDRNCDVIGYKQSWAQEKPKQKKRRHRKYYYYGY